MGLFPNNLLPMNTRTERPMPSEEQTDRQKPIERKPTRLESNRADTMLRYAQDRVVMRKKEAEQLVHAERAIEPNLDVLVEKFSKEVKDLEGQVDKLTEANTELEQRLELAREKLSHTTALRESEPSPQKAEMISFPESPKNEPTSSSPLAPPGLLGRLNRWLASMGRPQREQLSTSAYDNTQTPQAKEARAQARSGSMETIADAALQGNKESLQREQEALAQAQQDAQNASFFTRWRHNARIKELQNSIRFREAAIRAREAQLNKQDSSAAAAK